MLPAFLVGKVSDLTVPEHVKDFRAVRQELLRRGLFQARAEHLSAHDTRKRVVPSTCFLPTVSPWSSCAGGSSRQAPKSPQPLPWPFLLHAPTVALTHPLTPQHTRAAAAPGALPGA